MWILGNEGGKVASRLPEHYHFLKVENLIQGAQWNKEVIKSLFSNSGVVNILKIPIGITRRSDRWYWMHFAIGAYTVNSGYILAVKIEKGTNFAKNNGGESSTNQHRAGLWKFIWGLHVKHKIKYFL
ncbi:hypothetical protein ACH5RR_039921 [Cinchona calisaya]|uniref:Uncharacterized protein n=1 Tax=Cinchona calisaya TaxID=153742 RepID=A0ABD2Y0X3_9GENT